jgi:carboxyl-terminal processing protease
MPILALGIVGLSSLAGGFVTRVTHPRPSEPAAQDQLLDILGEDFAEGMSAIDANYAGKLDYESIGESSIQGMLRQLDPHSTYFTREKFDELQTEQRSRFYGIGVTIQRIHNRVFVLSANPEGPAAKAGLRYGDAIIAVDGQNAEDWSTDQVMQKVRGERGEPVQITVERLGTPSPITALLIRDEVKLPSVRNVFMVGPTIGYIALTGGFSRKTDEEVTEALDRLKPEGMRQLVLDLRGNPGGLLDEAVHVAEKFLPPGSKIVEVRGRDTESRIRSYQAADDNVPETMPMIVLVDRRTASASEVVSGALQDHARAFIVGENSFGKALVQTIYNLWGGTGLTLTTAKYYTPSGRCIQRDYSDVSVYDYYRKGTSGAAPKGPRGDALHTDLGAEVYGGGGITPDFEVKAPETNSARRSLYASVFDFARNLVAGLVPGLREYRIGETQHKQRLSTEDLEHYPITDRLIAAFKQHIADNPDFRMPDTQFNAHLDYIRQRLRTELTSAAFGPEAGQQVYLADDIQLRKAIEKLPEARTLAENVNRSRAERQ